MNDWINCSKIKVGEIGTAVNEGNLRKNDMNRKQNAQLPNKSSGLIKKTVFEALLNHLIRKEELFFLLIMLGNRIR